VPDEFAAAYRAAYEEAMRASAATGSHRAGEARPESADPAGPTGSAVPVGPSLGERWQALRTRAGRRWRARRTATSAGVRASLSGWRRRRWVLPLLAGIGALVLVLGAYFLGRAFSDEGRGGAASRTDANGRTVHSGGASTGTPNTPAVSSGRAWRGAVDPVTPTRVRASCTARSSVDSSGDPVSYRAGNVADGDASTAWRCNGTATGVRLVLRLPRPTDLAEVGLVPGYAKTDPVSHVDRYAQNNRIVRVRWTIGDVKVEQELDGSPGDRELQLLRIPRTTASRVTLEILEVVRGPRNTTAISEVSLAAAAD
jgi:hypothetical protein